MMSLFVLVATALLCVVGAAVVGLVIFLLLNERS